ncbi:hypothetical protein [Achromobacter insolitus]|uniref:hypothetical protein n=1 Tax=Achromobacter insolitus TaxID=217204 RepID=UPI003B9AD09A
MGFEKLADLREQLRAQAQKAVPVQPKAAGRTKKREPVQQKAAARPQQKREPVDPAVEAIWRLQKHFPQAFPKNPARNCRSNRASWPTPPSISKSWA